MQPNNQSNFNIVTTTKSSKGTKKGLIIGAIAVFFLAVSIAAGVYLVRQQQDIREKAEEALVCPAAEACPVAGDPTLLRSCYSLNNGDSPADISCSTIANVGSVASCGSSEYCCPSLGASWTSDLTACNQPSPSPTEAATPSPSPTIEATVSASPSPTVSASPSPTTLATVSPTTSTAATSTPTSTGTATPVPIPVTGTSWPTIIGAGVGILVIIGSILLVL